MACDKDAKVTENKNKKEEVKMEEVKTQEGVLVLKNMPEFEMEAYNAETGNYTKVSSEDYKGKWTVICFYPADFTFVWPTEIAAVNAALPFLKELGVEVLAISTDTKFSHKSL